FTFAVDTNPGTSSELPPRSEVVAADDLPSSVYTVVSNDDLLIDILLRLPVISLFMFKSVSKRWLSLFKDAHFTRRLSQITNLDPSCGLFLKIPIPTFPGFKYDFVSFDNIRIPTKRSFPFSFDSEAGRDADVLQSCNGLFLCCNDKSYYVCNPSNNLYRMLPQQDNPNNKPIDFPFGGMRMAFDPTKSPHYKVIYAGVVHDDELGHSIQIQTFSSENISKCSTHEGSWSVCRDHFPLLSFHGFKHGIYSNGAIHWLSSVDMELVHFKLDIVNEHPTLTSIQFPVTFATCDGSFYQDCKLLDSRGCLRLLCREDKIWHQLHMYEMRNGCSEWSVKYHVNLNDIMTTPLPKYWSIRLSAWCVVLGDREEDSFMLALVKGFRLLHHLLVVILLSDSGSGDDEGMSSAVTIGITSYYNFFDAFVENKNILSVDETKVKDDAAGLPVIIFVWFSHETEFEEDVASQARPISHIMNPYLHPLCGLFLEIPKRNRLKLDYDFVSFDNRIPSKRSTAFTSGSNAGRNADILQSCNGLFLCCISHSHREKYYVIGVFVPTTFVFRRFQHGIYWNGAIHWLNTLYEPSKHFKLDAVNEHPVLTPIQLPVTSNGNVIHDSKLLESCGCLLLFCREDAHSQQLNIYEMRNSYSEWSMKYHVNLNDIRTPFPITWSICFSVWCVVFREREEDSFMVIDLDGKVFQYKNMSKTVDTLIDLGSASPRESFPVFASFARCDPNF
ncbi:F-box protein-like protein isoform X1, partial [Tanacetum coccineum]